MYYDLEKIKNQFPAMNRNVWDKPLIYLDSAASMKKKKKVLDSINKNYSYGFTDKPFGAGKAEDAADAQQVMDRFISGHYIIENIDYIIEGPDAGIKQIVTLIRREWPTRIKNLEE